MKKASIVLGCIGILFTALPFIQTDHWWIRIFDFPRLQIAVFCLLSALLIMRYVSFKKPLNLALVTLLAAAFLYQASLVIQFTPLVPVEARSTAGEKKGDKFTILQCNVKMDNRRVQPFLEMVERLNPDILSINEPDLWWQNHFTRLEKVYPHSIKMPLPNTYGMVLYSKFPMKNTEINFLVEDGVPSFYTLIVLPSGKSFNLHCVHPEPPRPGSSTYDRDTELFIVGRRIKDEKGPTIVVGDLNDVAWSRTTKKFKELSGVLDPRKGRGLYNTFNANWPLLRYPLDHFFYTSHFQLGGLQKLEDIGSDHYPMFIELSL